MKEIDVLEQRMSNVIADARNMIHLLREAATTKDIHDKAMTQVALQRKAVEDRFTEAKKKEDQVATRERAVSAVEKKAYSLRKELLTKEQDLQRDKDALLRDQLKLADDKAKFEARIAKLQEKLSTPVI